MSDLNDPTERDQTGSTSAPSAGGGMRPVVGIAVVVAAILIVALIGVTVLVQRSQNRSSAPSTSTSTGTGDSAAAVRAVIQKANQEQQQAFAQDKPTLMRDTATAAYYAQLVKLDTTLRNGGVTAIQLRSLTFGQVVVQGTSAQATTTETWQATLANGSTASETSLNLYKLVLAGGAWKISSDTQPQTNLPPSSPGGSAAPTPATSPSTAPSPAGSPGTLGSTSRNWSGYVATGSGFTAVHGTWIVPTVSASTAGVDATWVGIGGATTTDLIQAGTQAVADNGSVQYSAWIETLPQPSQPVALTVNAGDGITVSITQQSTDVWSISIIDSTNGGAYTGTVTYTSSMSSAEWIEEAPTSGRAVVTLDQFGTVQFSNASAVENGQTVTAGAAGATAVKMVNGSGVQLAAPSALGASGSSFTVTRT